MMPRVCDIEIAPQESPAANYGFDITPRFHPQHGAWGTTPSMTEIDLPLLSRCIALEHNGTRLLWFGSDLVGDTVPDTDALRDEVAGELGLSKVGTQRGWEALKAVGWPKAGCPV